MEKYQKRVWKAIRDDVMFIQKVKFFFGLSPLSGTKMSIVNDLLTVVQFIDRVNFR